MTVDREMLNAIEDRVSLEHGLRVVQWCAETKNLPDEGLLPCFNDSLLSDLLVSVLESVSGKRYED